LACFQAKAQYKIRKRWNGEQEQEDEAGGGGGGGQQEKEREKGGGHMIFSQLRSCGMNIYCVITLHTKRK
jgi:hypothetical protein